MMEQVLVLSLVFIWISAVTGTSANEHGDSIYYRKLACRNIGGRCIKKGKKCPGDLSLETNKGKPYCKRRRRCCYPDDPTLISDAPLCGDNFALERSSSRIVNGDNVTSPYEYSWQVGIANAEDEDFFCGGSVITKNHILTAAHCFFEKCVNQLPKVLYVGIASNLQNETKRIEFKGRSEKQGTKLPTVFLGRYNCVTHENDIAIIALRKIDLFADNLIPICLPKDVTEQFVGKKATVTGWGSIEGYNTTPPYPDPDLPNILQVAIMPVLSNEVCMENASNILSNMICAATKEGFENPNREDKAPCKGDSGGPLSVIDGGEGRYIQIGIVSHAKGCASKGNPDVFTRTSSFLTWIKQMVVPLNIQTL